MDQFQAEARAREAASMAASISRQAAEQAILGTGKTATPGALAGQVKANASDWSTDQAWKDRGLKPGGGADGGRPANTVNVGGVNITIDGSQRMQGAGAGTDMARLNKGLSDVVGALGLEDHTAGAWDGGRR